jgi:arginyl-tRNA synthetase
MKSVSLSDAMTVQQELQDKVNTALAGVLGDADTSSLAPETLRVVPTAHPQFGDYQFNGALPLAKVLKQNPRALAQGLVEKLDVANISEPPEIAGPGFVNFRLKPEYLNRKLEAVAQGDRLGVPQAENPRTVVVDYPSPNVAKPLHVGHIRTMFIGDAIARLLRFAGHRVVADNHIGDWGTPIGMVIWGWKRFRDEEKFRESPLDEMGRIYKIVKARTGEDKEVLNAVREETAKLHAGDEENLAIWKTLRTASLPELDKVYHALGIELDETLGESFYHDRLSALVDKLKAEGIATESQGAIVIPFEEPPHLRDKPMLIQKSDGGFLYATTDLATIDYRVERWHPDEIVYVVDARQSDHFRQLFAAAKKWAHEDNKLEGIELNHVAFGTILGEDGTPIKTREGEPPRLDDLLDEAQSRALEIARAKNAELPEDKLQEIARVLGVGALKYADLSQNRTSDYQFSWDKMLALTGNSAVYLEYAYVRTRSILRRAESTPGAVQLQDASEIELAKFLLRFPLAIETAQSDYRINALSDYLFELAQKFAAFYENCPVLQSESPLRESRLALVQLTGDVLKRGLNLLGIETIEQM